MTKRVFVPLSMSALARHVEDDEVPSGQDRLVVEQEDEASEHGALAEAAELCDRVDRGGRRVVLVAEIGDDEDPDQPLALSRLVAVHCDPVDGARTPGEDLGWFGVQEIPGLLAGEL